MKLVSLFKKIVIFVSLLSSFHFAVAADLTTSILLSKEPVGYPLYLNLSKLALTIQKNKIDQTVPTSNLSIRLYDLDNKVIFTQKMNYEASLLRSCFSMGTICTLSPIDLPLALESVSCSFDYDLKTADGDLIGGGGKYSWGECRAYPSSLSLKKPDIRVTEDSFKIREQALGIEPNRSFSMSYENIGRGDSDFEFKALVIGFNSLGQVIWGSSAVGLNIPSLYAPPVSFEFLDSIRPWQWHQLCKVKVILDQGYKIPETQKNNNEFIAPLGSCEIPPNPEKDFFDFKAELKTDSEKLLFIFTNLSRLSLESNSVVDYRLQAFDKSGKVLVSFDGVIQGPWFGFGEQKVFEAGSFPESACRFVLKVNHQEILKEVNHLNNVGELNYCL